MMLMNFDIFDVLKLAMDKQILIQGTKEDLCRLLNATELDIKGRDRKRYGIIWRTFIQYFLWQLGGPYDSASINVTDYLTGSDIKDISKYYLFSVIDDGHHYHYDIRTLENFNVYTSKPLEMETLQRYHRKVKWLKKLDFPITTQDHNQSELRTLKQYAVDVFCLVSKYFHCDDEWFVNLSFLQLVNLYNYIADIWDYRADVSMEEKCNIVHNGIICPTKVDRYTINMIDKLRRQVLRNIERLVTEGLTDSHRTLGALFVMLALVQVSNEASSFYPNLLQVVL